MKYLSGLILILSGLSLSGCNDQPDMGNFRAGLTDSCRAQSPFVAKTGLAQPVAIDTRQRGYTGLQLLSIRDQKTWQHPSWGDAGFIGAFARDRHGNIFLAPTPNVSVSTETLTLSNTLYRIDAQSGEMAAFLELPAANPLSSSNPFGIIGLYFDCDTDSLYVSSVAGSTAREVAGRIYQVDVANQKIVAQLDKTDAFGISTFNGMQHKRLYLSSARSADVYSVALDKNGSFTKDVRFEFSLTGLPGGDSSNIRKFEIKRAKDGSYTMAAKEENFRFSLLASHNPVKRVYHFTYSTSDDRWDFKHITTGR